MPARSSIHDSVNTILGEGCHQAGNIVSFLSRNVPSISGGWRDIRQVHSAANGLDDLSSQIGLHMIFLSRDKSKRMIPALRVCEIRDRNQENPVLRSIFLPASILSSPPEALHEIFVLLQIESAVGAKEGTVIKIFVVWIELDELQHLSQGLFIFLNKKIFVYYG